MLVYKVVGDRWIAVLAAALAPWLALLHLIRPAARGSRCCSMGWTGQ